jgi:5,10-methylenetetrahydrofolate reductase
MSSQSFLYIVFTIDEVSEFEVGANRIVSFPFFDVGMVLQYSHSPRSAKFNIPQMNAANEKK